MFRQQDWTLLRIAQIAARSVVVMALCAAAAAEEAGQVDKRLLSKALAAPAGDLAQSYASSKAALSMVELAAHGITLQLGDRKVTQRNAAKVRREYETRIATYRAAIEKRGVMDIAGEYTATAVGCAKSGSSWAGLVEEGFDKAVIAQTGPEVTLNVMGEYEGQALDLQAAGVTVENMLSMIDPMNSDYPLTGQIGDGRITIRPQADLVLRAWPGWAGPPQRQDVESCVVTLQRAAAP
ncbi:MAG TPA: hypothetical protein VFG48_05625 [Xanthomonadales bacterium]|nr:hypothetical protein [Xanthomonadales bacterium]